MNCQPLFCINTTMTDKLFDFGFTLVDEEELEVVQLASTQAESSNANAESTQEKLDRLLGAIQPLLNNLKSNPEKEYILWPNRLNKIEEFENHILNIYKGN